MIRIFSKLKRELYSDIDTWIVEWTTYKSGISIEYPRVKKNYQAFTVENEARDYANTLNDSMKLLGITSLPLAKVYKQKANNL